MHNRYLKLLLGSLFVAPALYCQAEREESALLSLKADPLILKALYADGVIEENGDDADLRPRYEGTRCAFEQFFKEALTSGEINRMFAIIHTGEVAPDISALLATSGTIMVAYPSLAKYPDAQFEIPLGCLEIAKEMTGATYLFETQEGEWRTFSVRFTHPIAPAQASHAAMWLGDVERGPAAERLAQVSAYLQACQGPDLLSLLK